MTAKICRTHKFGGRAYRLSFGLVTAHSDDLPDLTGAVGPVHDEGFPPLTPKTPYKAGRIGRVLEAADLDREVGAGSLRSHGSVGGGRWGGGCRRCGSPALR